MDISFEKGFSVVTGETGSGKSIILGALGLIMGQRANQTSLPQGEDKCIVEGTFNLENINLTGLFKQHELDYETETIIRREINKDGKSRAFINDTPVKLSTLKEFSEQLINIHSQHQIVTLNNTNFQLSVIDSFAGINKNTGSFRSLFSNYKIKKLQLTTLIKKQEELLADQDYQHFLLNELLEIKISEEEFQLLEDELNLMENAEDIKQRLFNLQQTLNEGDENILSNILSGISTINKIKDFDKEINSIHDRLNSTYLEIEDIANSIEKKQQEILYDPKRIEEINNHVDIIYRLEQKHHVSGINALLEITKDIEGKIKKFTSLEIEIKSLQEILNKEYKELVNLAKDVSHLRKKAIPLIEKEVSEKLKQLGLPKAKFNIELTQGEELHKDGIDHVKFMFNANPGSPIQELSKVASGGELSRIMLSIKSLISENNLLPTIIFDEIDSGVSGEIAGKVGDILFQLGQNMQVLAITHIPQIAARGQHHYQVTKQVKGNNTTSHIQKINKEDRILEIANMIEGKNHSKQAFETAKNMILN